MGATPTEQQNFFERITTIVQEKEITYLDALIWWCEESGLEIAVAAELTNAALKIKLEENAIQLKLLKKQRKLF